MGFHTYQGIPSFQNLALGFANLNSKNQQQGYPERVATEKDGTISKMARGPRQDALIC